MRKVTQALWFGALGIGVTFVAAVDPGGAAGGHDVSIQAGQFDPRELTVEVGEEVTWTNKDSGHVHSVTADDGSFDSNPTCSAGNPGACMDDRDQFSHVFSAEGRFPYHSKTSGGPGGQGTSGVVVVVAADTPPTTPTSAPVPKKSLASRSSPGTAVPMSRVVSGTDGAPRS